MNYNFECKVCNKLAVCETKEEVQKLKDLHWTYDKKGNKSHVPIFNTCHIETRTSKNSKRPYVVIVAD